MSNDKKIEDKKEEVKEPSAQDFAIQYDKLCVSTGFRIVVSPAWLARDDGTFSLVLQYTVGKLPQKT